MVNHPFEYRWSSYAAKVGGKKDPVVDLHASYFSMGNSAHERQKAYAEYVLETVPEYEIKLIRDALQRGQVTGGDRFRTEIERKLNIRISNKKQGRPKKKLGK